jgi:hypothetical protein
MKQRIEALNQACGADDAEMIREQVEPILRAFGQFFERGECCELLGVYWEMVRDTLQRNGVIRKCHALQWPIAEVNARFQAAKFVSVPPGSSSFEREFLLHCVAYRRAKDAGDGNVLKALFGDLLLARPFYDFPEKTRQDYLGTSVGLTLLVRKARENGADGELEELWQAVRRAYPFGEFIFRGKEKLPDEEEM